MKVGNADLETMIEEIGLHSRGTNRTNKRCPMMANARVSVFARKAKRDAEVLAQHGPVKQIMKDGERC